ncbi:MAG: hypothetical protein J5493_00410 [Lachnospiraceae bacterium]|nr:hypothetical protein [Lachnospiraceae bacterium]
MGNELIAKEEHFFYNQSAKSERDDSESTKTHYSREVAETNKKNSAITNDKQPDTKPAGSGKFSRDPEERYSLDLTPPESELERLRRENAGLQMIYQQLLREKRGTLPRGPLDRYNSSAILQILPDR